MKAIAIDVGYGYTKATDGKKNIVFQSVVSPIHELLLGENIKMNYLTGIKRKQRKIFCRRSCKGR